MHKEDIKSLEDLDYILDSEDLDYEYIPELTKELDNLNLDFDYEILYKMTLWKINRFPFIEKDTLRLLNQIDKEAIEMTDEIKCKAELVLKKLLLTKGVRLPMASTYLRFRNPNLFQIIDRRAYRILKKENYHSKDVTEKNVVKIVENYFKYLELLRIAFKQFKKANQDVLNVNSDSKLDLEFKNMDRILYNMDKNKNKNL